MIRMILCTVIGLLIVSLKDVSSLSLTTPKLLLPAILCAVGTATFTVSWILAVRTMIYMLVEVFVMAGVIIPLTLCAVLYNEPIGPMQIIGLLLLLAGVYLMCTYKKSEKARLSLKNFLLLLLCTFSSGISSFSQKLYVKGIENADASVFNFYTYLFAAIILLGIFLCFRLKEKKKGTLPSSRAVVKPIFHYIVIMAVCLFLNTYFKTLSASHLDAILLYPLEQGSSVVLSLTMSIFIFKEKITIKGIVGIALSVISVILINAFA